MTLATGARLGPYEIVSPLGAGGMGEVYRAKDTRLGRKVAVKVLPAEVANDPERLRRFEQEAKAASALNHPNILTVHDVGTHEGTAYLVTELLAGEPVRERLREGPLPWRRAIEIAVQVARGLAAAHDRGIVHRDLKPENLFLTEHGVAKVLDFGLARVDRPELAGASLQEASTVLETSAGTVLGTVGYMAPEQVRGERADARSDLFALGIVLHEMLAGANPFRRESVVESLSAILKESAPELPAIVPGAPPGLARVGARLLEKRPGDRFQSARDLAFALEELLGAPSGEVASLSANRNARRGYWLAAVAGLSVLGAVLAFLVWRPTGSPPPTAPAVARFLLAPPEGKTFAVDSSGGFVAVSPRGDALAIGVTDERGRQHLQLRTTGETTFRPLPHSDGARLPFWSPDGAAIAFEANGRLRRVDLAGGTVSDLGELDASFSGGSWSEDGSLLLGFGHLLAGPIRGIARVPALGGAPEPVTTVDASRGEVQHLAPVALPGGAFLYLARYRDGTRRILAVPRGGGTARPLLESQSGAAYAAGHLFHTVDGRLRAQRFDPHTLELAGEPAVLSPQLRFHVFASRAIFSAGEVTLAYQAYGTDFDEQLYWYERDGRATPAFVPSWQGAPAVSLDGRRVVAGGGFASDGTIHIWLYDLVRGTAEGLTRTAANDVNPTWCDGGQTVVFTRQLPDFASQIVALDLRTRDERVVLEEPQVLALHCEGDGSRLLLRSGSPEGFAFELLDLASGERERLAAGDLPGWRRATIAPGGRWLASADAVDGEARVFVWDLTGATPRIQIARGAREPRWTPDGRELIFLGDDAALYSVAVTPSGGGVDFGSPRRLFPVRASQYGTAYSLAGDGRILVNIQIADATVAPLTVIVGWRALLGRR